jgi:hypothetical protein
LALKDLSRLTPTAVALTNLRFTTAAEDYNLSLTGQLATTSTPPEIVLAELVEALRASPFFEDVTIQRHSKRATETGHSIQFSLDLRGVIS